MANQNTSRPETDWKILLLSTFVLVVLVAATSIFTFIKVDKEDVFVVENSSKSMGQSLNIELLRNTLSYYQSKSAEFDRIVKERPPAVDPSI